MQQQVMGLFPIPVAIIDTGSDYNNTYMWFWKIKDGKAIVWEEYADMGLAERAFGTNLKEILPILGEILARNC